MFRKESGMTRFFETTPPPDQEKRPLEVPELYFSDWLEAMTDRVKEVLANQERAVINLAGASASGKGEASNRLKERLENEGIEAVVFSTDNFYKGISRMIAQNIPEHLSLDEASEVDLQELSDYIRSVIGDLPFDKKFSSENLAQIEKFVQKKYPVLADKIMTGIVYEKDHLDFDNPRVVDLEAVNASVKSLKAGGQASIPEYSMKISEQDGATEVDGKKVKVIIIEGLYGLNDQVLEASDIRSYIEAEIKTLLMRRMRRDVLKGRSSFSPEMNLWITLQIVLPAYNKYILPTKKNAELILANTYTEQETADTNNYDVQDKLPLSVDELSAIEALCGQAVEVFEQADYYFTNEALGHDPKHLIRVRVENGVIKNLVHKGTKAVRDDGKIIRPTEEYVKDGEFGNFYSNPEDLLKAFNGAGFSLVEKIQKGRIIYKYDEIELAVDKISGLGLFLELRANNKISAEPKIDELKARLRLNDKPSVGPYIDEFLNTKRKK